MACGIWLISIAGVGCGNHTQPTPPTDATAPPVLATVTPMNVPQMDLPVKEGSMPLAYLVETTGGVRVVDETNRHALAQATLAGRSIISIDEQRGVSMAGTIFSPGPLPADHRFAIYFYPGGFNPEEDIRSTVERSTPATGPSPHASPHASPQN